MTTRDEYNRSATTTGALIGSAVAAVLLLLLAVLLTREPGSALKSVVAVWLAALPVLGLGALCGWLLTAALQAATRGRTAGDRER
jgi:formate/nitrite transporter FocA (FNT family)